MTPELLDLRQQAQENLIRFLRTEVELGSTFSQLAESTKSPEHRGQLLEDVQKVVRAIRHFGERITDAAIRADLNHDADRLDEFLDRNSK